MQPAPSIYRMLYRSRPTTKVAENLVNVVDEILEISLYRNYSVGLSGILLVAKGYFIQALEGNAKDVTSTYGRISLDRRHTELQVISHGPVDQRLFSEWAMCAGHITPNDSSIVNSLWARADFHPEKLTALSAERLLVAVADLQRRGSPDVLI